MLFWVFSVVGSVLLFTYGWLRDDFSIIFGEFLSFYIYLWNLKAKGIGRHISRYVMNILYCVPLLSLVLVFHDLPRFISSFLQNDSVPVWAIIWGATGQFIYKMRFVYQWFYSVRHGESSLPITFWMIAVTGSLLIISYGLFRHDWILVIGQVGIVASFRNIVIGLAARK